MGQLHTCILAIGPNIRMQIIVLIPAALCIFSLFHSSVSKTFQNVFLPILLMLPTYYFWKVPALPPIDMNEAVLIPLAVGILLRHLKDWRISPMDLWMTVFVFTTGYADALQHRDTASTFQIFAGLFTAFVSYLAGKLLIEQQGERLATVQKFVFYLFIASLFSEYEYRMGRNPYQIIMGRLLPEEQFGWKTQIRWGFGRVAGPFGQSELAGMMLLAGLVLALWLSYYNLWEPKFKYASWLPFSKGRTITFILGLTLIFTQARGPWLGTLFAVPIACIGRSRRVLLSTLLVAALGTIFAASLYVGMKAYTDAPTTTNEQENATYRAHLLENYTPVVKEGGLWGWGTEFPTRKGQTSIDNEYLFVAVTQGWVGFGAFCLICLGSIINFVSATLGSTDTMERYFAFSLLGILLGMMFTIGTVFLGNQSYLLFFLLVGWSEAMRPRPIEKTGLSFQWVLT